jgi:hypothetical protein
MRTPSKRATEKFRNKNDGARRSLQSLQYSFDTCDQCKSIFGNFFRFSVTILEKCASIGAF